MSTTLGNRPQKINNTGLEQLNKSCCVCLMSDLIDLTETFYLVLWIRFILDTFYFEQDSYVISLDILSTLEDHP